MVGAAPGARTLRSTPHLAHMDMNSSEDAENLVYP